MPNQARLCECEHISHFHPEGTASHPYSEAVATHKVTTGHGDFFVCASCLMEHGEFFVGAKPLSQAGSDA